MSKSRPHRSRTPQDKKRLSYAKDRRAARAERSGARFTVAKRKASAKRAIRRSGKQSIRLWDRVSEARADLAESSTRRDTRRRASWRKDPDMSLGDYIALKRASRTGRDFRRRRMRVIALPSGGFMRLQERL